MSYAVQIPCVHFSAQKIQEAIMSYKYRMSACYSAPYSGLMVEFIQLDDDSIKDLMEKTENMEDDEAFDIIDEYIKDNDGDRCYLIEKSHGNLRGEYSSLTVTDEDGEEVYCGDLRKIPNNNKDIDYSFFNSAGKYIVLVGEAVGKFSDEVCELNEPFDPEKLYYNASAMPTAVKKILGFTCAVSPECELRYQEEEDVLDFTGEYNDEFYAEFYILKIDERGECKVLRHDFNDEKD